MCNFEVLINSSSGYITKCRSCNNFEMAFGNVNFPIKESDFVVLYSVVRKEVKERLQDLDASTRKIYLAIPGTAARMVFSNSELKNFLKIVEEGYRQNEINKLVYQCKNGSFIS